MLKPKIIEENPNLIGIYKDDSLKLIINFEYLSVKLLQEVIQLRQDYLNSKSKLKPTSKKKSKKK